MMEQDEKESVAKRILVRAFDSANDAKTFLKGKEEPRFNLVDVFNRFRYMYKFDDEVTRLRHDDYSYYIPLPIEELERILISRDDVDYIDIRAFRDGQTGGGADTGNGQQLRSPKHG